MTTTENTTVSSYDYRVTTDVPAPAATVWQAWTDAKHYETWFHAVPGSVALDTRPGGAWQATMVAPDGSQHELTGSYGEIVENQRIVTLMDVPGREPAAMVMELTERAGITTIALSQTCETGEERDQAKGGSEVLLQWCAEHVATM